MAETAEYALDSWQKRPASEKCYYADEQHTGVIFPNILLTMN